MMRKTALVNSFGNFKLNSVPFDSIPGQSKLFLDFQRNATAIKEFYPACEKSFKELSEEVLSNFTVDRDALCNVLLEQNRAFSAGEKTLENIDRLRQSDCVAVISGQQAGLFAGPIYTIYKALSAIKLAEELTNQGVNAVPIFWVASEDHDFEEVNEAFVLDDSGKLEAFANDVGKVSGNTPVALVELGEEIEKTIEHFSSNLRKTEYTEKTKGFLQESYQASESYETGFAKLVLNLLGDFGLIAVSPMDEGLRKLCSPIYVQAIEKHKKIAPAILKRNESLVKEGYHTQVHVEEDFFPFFYLSEGNTRNALRFNTEEDLIVSRTSKDEFSVSELLDLAEHSPHRLSPSALMRPVVQDFLFPTVCYYGGGAEISYFAQNEVIYRTLNRPQTKFRHRASFTIIEPKSERILDQYDLGFSDILKEKDLILAEIIEKYLAIETASEIDEIEEAIELNLSKLTETLSKSEPTLAANSENRRKKITWHIETLRKKFHRAEIIKNDVLRRRVDFVTSSLYPRNALQERTLNITHFINLFGPNFIGWLHKAIDLEEREHQILVL